MRKEFIMNNSHKDASLILFKIDFKRNILICANLW